MSEITRKKFEKKVALKHGTLTIKGRPWTTPSELGKEADFERKVEEARRMEQQFKEELRLAKEEVERKLLRVVAQQIEDEEKGYWTYQTLATQLSALGLDITASDVRRYAEDENRHKEGLKRLFSTIRGAPFKGKG